MYRQSFTSTRCDLRLYVIGSCVVMSIVKTSQRPMTQVHQIAIVAPLASS